MAQPPIPNEKPTGKDRRDSAKGPLQAFGWAALQSWAVKAVSLGLFFLLARLLGKEEMGRAQSVLLALMLLALLAEQGLLQALIQRQALSAQELNVPFFLMLGCALGLALLLLFAANPLAALMGAPELAPLLRWATPIPPLTVLVGFMAAIYKRRLDTRRVAQAAFAGSIISAVVALLVALQGFGALSLVVQVLVMNSVQLLVLWWRAPWAPSRSFDLAGFRDLLRFSTAVFASRCVDYMVSRSVEFFILARVGVAGLGVFAIAAKLYLTLVELFAQAIFDVALSTLSRLREDRVKFGQAYQHLIVLASSSTTPLFVLVALLSTDLCVLLFGPTWREAGVALQWLSILGAAEVMQYFNGAAMGASGRPRWILGINLAKLVMASSALYFAPSEGLNDLVRNYVLGMLCVTPLSFWVGSRATELPFGSVILRLMPAFSACAVAAWFVHLAKPWLAQEFAVVRMLLLACLFAATFALLVFAINRRRLALALSELRALKFKNT